MIETSPMAFEHDHDHDHDHEYDADLRVGLGGSQNRPLQAKKKNLSAFSASSAVKISIAEGDSKRSGNSHQLAIRGDRFGF